MCDRRVALITGANSGIGKVIAMVLAKEGYNIIINYAFNEDLAIESQKEIQDLGVECELLHGDVSDFEATQVMMKNAFDLFGKVDVLVNNAGITRDQLVLRMTEKDFDDVINVNLKGTFNCIKGVTKKMFKQREGKIINIASVVGLMGNMGQCNYSASKAGVIGITKSLAKEYAPRNIQVNAIAPGFIQTAMTDKLTDDQKQAMLNVIPAKKFGSPEDVANVVAFLASKKADYVTGQVLAVDGGMTYS